MIANGLTKPLAGSLFSKFRADLGLVNITEEILATTARSRRETEGTQVLLTVGLERVRLIN